MGDEGEDRRDEVVGERRRVVDSEEAYIGSRSYPARDDDMVVFSYTTRCFQTSNLVTTAPSTAEIERKS
jgi:hypothetical protein